MLLGLSLYNDFYRTTLTYTDVEGNSANATKTTEEGINTGIRMVVDQVKDILPSGDEVPEITYNDRYIENGAYIDGEGDSDVIRLNRTDGESVDIDTSEFTAWYEGD